MNIWSWVHETENQLYEDGHERLADIMSLIPSHTCDDEHDKVDALYAEGLVLAKDHPNKWIEVFLRHWHLQSQVLHRYNSRGSLSEAIDLLEFSHRDDTRDCPQSICAVQDLANCYGLRDGPGFVRERLDVCNETLARIDPNWPCYNCIGAELVSAYRDADMHTEALQKMHELRAEMLKNGQHPEDTLVLSEIHCYLALGQLEKAEELARAAKNDGGGESFLHEKSQLIALILTEQGRFDEAQEHMLPFSTIVETASRYKSWCRASVNFARHDPERNSIQLDYDFSFLYERALNNGAVRLALQIATYRIELALLRGDAYGAQCGMEQAELVIPQLNQDMGARAATDALAARLNALVEQRSAQPNPATLENMLGPDSDEPDADLFDIARLHSQYEDNAELAIAFGNALGRRGFYRQCSDVFEAFLKRHPNHIQVLARFGHSLLDRHETQAFDERFDNVDASEFENDAATAFHWVSARRWHHAAPATALQHLESILAINPNDGASRSKAAVLQQDLGNYDAALDHFQALLDTTEDVNRVHWDRLVCATLIERWDLVRESAATLDMALSTTEGPVDEEWGVIRVRFRDEKDESLSLRALRTGPVTARILDFSRFGDTQYYDHNIVFDAYPLNKLDQKDEEGHAHDAEGYYTYLYDAVRRTPGPDYFYFTLDGMYPGDEAWAALEKAMHDDPDLLISRRSGEQYTVTDSRTDEEQTGVYAIVGVLEGRDLRSVHELLEAATAELKHPLIWPHLAAELEDAETLAKQAAIELRYGLE